MYMTIKEITNSLFEIRSMIHARAKTDLLLSCAQALKSKLQASKMVQLDEVKVYYCLYALLQ